MDTNEIKLSDVKVGQTWLMDSPFRVGRVEGPTQVQYRDRLTGMVLPQSGFRVRMTLPDKPIEGFISPAKAGETAMLKQSVIRACSHLDGDDSEWFEIWANRLVFPIKYDSKARCNRVIDGKPESRILQLAVLAEEGRGSLRGTTSTSVNSAVLGRLIPSELVPVGLFKGEEDAQEDRGPEADEEAAPAVEEGASVSPKKRSAKPRSGGNRSRQAVKA